MRRRPTIRTGCEVSHRDPLLAFGVPAWLISFVVHLSFLILIGLISTQLPNDQVTLTLTAPLAVTDELDIEIPEQFRADEVWTDDIGSGGLYGTDLAAALAPEITPVTRAPMPDVAMMNVGSISLQQTFDLATGDDFAQNFAIQGSVGTVTSGAEGAIDRLTQEILLSLEERPTLVAWLFDRSGSLLRQRAAIRDRFDRIYHELGIIESSGSVAAHSADQPLLSSVIAFAGDWQLMTPRPTSDLAELKSAIDAIPRDDTGVENVFQAVGAASEQFRRFRRANTTSGSPMRNVMLIVVTDEVGNDQQLLDETVTICRKRAMPVYVVGVPSPFGRVEAKVKWVDPDPDYDQTPRWGVVDQGPESLYAERLKLLPAGATDMEIDSGFGPFALTRLCFETGGIYFAVHPNRDTTRPVRRSETEAFSAHFRKFFRPEVMRRYRPDYVSAAEYQRRVADNKARTALVKAAGASRIQTMAAPKTRFIVSSDAALARQLTNAQKEAAKLEPQLRRIYNDLLLGEKDRAHEKAPRWQAGYDLAMGRAIAAKVRTESYNAALAMAKRGMEFTEAGMNTWVLAPSNEIITGSQTQNDAKKAIEYLTRVVREHPDTPWAMLAQRELDIPLSWVWQEDFTDLAPRPRQRPSRRPPPPENDEAVRVPKPKPMRPVPKL